MRRNQEEEEPESLLQPHPQPHLQLLLLSVVLDEDLLQLVVDALHAAGDPGDGGLGHRDVGQRHLGRLRHGHTLQHNARAHTHTHRRLKGNADTKWF